MAYRGDEVRNRYQGDRRQQADAREQFLGRTQQPGGALGGGDRAGPGQGAAARPGTGDRPDAGARPGADRPGAGAGQRPDAGARPGGARPGGAGGDRPAAGTRPGGDRPTGGAGVAQRPSGGAGAGAAQRPAGGGVGASGRPQVSQQPAAARGSGAQGFQGLGAGRPDAHRRARGRAVQHQLQHGVPRIVRSPRLEKLCLDKARARGWTYQQVHDEYREDMALRRLTEPQDVANALVFLASADSRNITGQELVVDGGWDL